jgi:hypothetical protein
MEPDRPPHNDSDGEAQSEGRSTQAQAHALSPALQESRARESSAAGATRNEILRETTARLVRSRRQELRELKVRLRELSRAICRVEELRVELEALVDTDLIVANRLATTFLELDDGTPSTYSFSQYLQALLEHFAAARSE